MTPDYFYAQHFSDKGAAQDYAKSLRKRKRKAIVEKKSVGKKKFNYFVYATKAKT